jgi:hypothetical protein
MKSEYGPTLGRVLAPRWRTASRWTRAAVIGAGVVAVALAAGLALTLKNARYSQGGKVPFGFEYRGLYRVAPDPGAFVKIDSRDSEGALNYSYEVYPLKLPPYSTGLWGELPLYSASYTATLAHTLPEFVLIGEGKTKITNTTTGYAVLYTTVVNGREMYGRNVMLLPDERAGVREGVVVAMLTAEAASAQVKSPSEVASTGVLLRPLKTFTFG